MTAWRGSKAFKFVFMFSVIIVVAVIIVVLVMVIAKPWDNSGVEKADFTKRNNSRISLNKHSERVLMNMAHFHSQAPTVKPTAKPAGLVQVAETSFLQEAGETAFLQEQQSGAYKYNPVSEYKFQMVNTGPPVRVEFAEPPRKDMWIDGAEKGQKFMVDVPTAPEHGLEIQINDKLSIRFKWENHASIFFQIIDHSSDSGPKVKKEYLMPFAEIELKPSIECVKAGTSVHKCDSGGSLDIREGMIEYVLTAKDARNAWDYLEKSKVTIVFRHDPTKEDSLKPWHTDWEFSWVDPDVSDSDSHSEKNGGNGRLSQVICFKSSNPKFFLNVDPASQDDRYPVLHSGDDPLSFKLQFKNIDDQAKKVGVAASRGRPPTVDQWKEPQGTADAWPDMDPRPAG